MALPVELKQQKNWIVWKDDKQPYSAVTLQQQGWQKPENWTDFHTAFRTYKGKGFSGVGFVFQFPYVGIDLDDCIEEDGMMNELARAVTHDIDTYTEYSRSGRGLHLYCKVTEPIRALKAAGIEIYGEGRYFIVTNRELDAMQLEVTERTENIKELLRKHGVHTASQQVRRECFPEGERNNRMASEIGRMFNYWDAATVREMAHVLNKNMCRPPLEDTEVDTIVKSIGKREIHPTPPAAAMEQKDWEHIEGMRDLDKVPYKGIAKPRGRYIPTGICQLDYATNMLAPGCTTLITGRTNAGKSVFVKQITAKAIDAGNKVLSIMGEGDQETAINALYQCVIGRSQYLFEYVKINMRWHKEPKRFVLNALQQWHKGKLVMFDKGQSKFKTMGELFEMIEHEVDEKEFNLVVIDNLMSVLTAKAVEKNEAQGEFMQRCHDLAEKYRIHIALVLHPNKEYRKGDELELEQISGNSDLYNKADNVIAVLREYSLEKTRAGRNGKIVLLKNRYYSDLLTCETHFDGDTGLLLEIYNDVTLPYEFDWNKYIDVKEAPGNILALIRGDLGERQLREPGEE